MATTFAGSILQEPSDFAARFSERDLIAVGDDPKSPSARDVSDWDDLTPDQLAEVVPTIDAVIASVESEIGLRAAAGGYAVPLNPVDPVIKTLAAHLAMIEFRRRRRLTVPDDDARWAERQLADLAAGKMGLTAAKTGTPAEGAAIFSYGSNERTFTRDTLEGW